MSEPAITPGSSQPVLSLVIPVYNEAEHLVDSLRKIEAVVAPMSLSYEILLIDDGSMDQSWNIISDLSRRNPRIKALRLSRNFGKEAALCAGLDRTNGAACIIMDADLQHPPDLIPEMVRFWREGFPIVEAVKRSRNDSSQVNQYGARLFYGLMQYLAGLDLHQGSDFKLLDARIIAAWRLLQERQTFFRGLTAWLGFPRAQVYFEVADRAGGASKWSKLGLAKLALRAITSFSSLPLHIVTTLGIVFLLGAIPLGLEALYFKIIGVAVDGFTTVILLLLIIGSILMISLGIIGTYIARIFDEVKNRPRYLIADTSGVDYNSPGASSVK